MLNLYEENTQIKPMEKLRSYVKRLGKENETEVENLLKIYVKNEPMIKHLKLTEVDKHIFIQTYLQTVLPQGISVGLYDANSDVMCGCALFSLASCCVGEEEYKKIAKQCQQRMSEKFMQMQRFDEHMESFAYNDIPTDNFVMNELGIIKPNYQHQRLADKLLEWSYKIAMEKHCDSVVLVASSSYSAKVGLRHGFQTVQTVYYKDYKEPVSGEAIFAGMPSPHDCCVLQIKMMKKEPKL